MQETKEPMVQQQSSDSTVKETPTILRSQIKHIVDVALSNNMPGVLVVRELVSLL